MLILMKKILNQIEYLAYIHVQGGWAGGFQIEAQKILESHPYGGYAELDESPGSDLRAGAGA